MTTNQTIDGVLVSRELLERFVSDVEAHNYGFEGLDELRALLDAPAGTDWKAAHDTVLAHHRETFAEHVAEIERLKAEHPAPVAVVLPARLLGDDGVCTESHYASGWNACLYEAARLNGIEP